jgi:hypothetical protein
MRSPALVRFRPLGLMLLAGFLLTFSGCLRETTQGDVQTFTYPWWVAVTIFLAGAATTWLGYVLLPKNDKPAYVMLLVGPVVALAVAPSYFFYKVTVGPEELTARYGPFGVGTVQRVKYSELAEVKFTFTRSRRSTTYFLDCKKQDEDLVSLSLDIQGIKAAAPRFIQYVRAKNIPVVDHSGEPLQLGSGL